MNVTAEFRPSVRQLAELFCSLGSGDMAQFLVECNDISQAWPSGHGIYMQALYVQQEAPPKTPGGEFIMNFAAPWFHHALCAMEGK